MTDEKSINKQRQELWTLLCEISHCGDDDEAISKHIIHSLTAICLGMTWEECLDYKTGGWSVTQMNALQIAEEDGIIHKGDTRPQWLEICKAFDDENKARLAPKWEQVKNIADELGLEEFYNMLQSKEPIELSRIDGSTFVPNTAENGFERWTLDRIAMYAQDHHRYDKVEVPEWLKE